VPVILLVIIMIYILYLVLNNSLSLFIIVSAWSMNDSVKGDDRPTTAPDTTPRADGNDITDSR